MTPLLNYEKNGFAVIKYLNSRQFNSIKKFAVDWVSEIYRKNSIRLENEEALKSYHLNKLVTEPIHAACLTAKNRHLLMPIKFKKNILNQTLISFLSDVGFGSFEF